MILPTDIVHEDASLLLALRNTAKTEIKPKLRDALIAIADWLDLCGKSVAQYPSLSNVRDINMAVVNAVRMLDKATPLPDGGPNMSGGTEGAELVA